MNSYKGYHTKQSARDFNSLENDLASITSLEQIETIVNKHYCATAFKLRQEGKCNEALLMDKLFDKVIDKHERKEDYGYINALLMLQIISQHKAQEPEVEQSDELLGNDTKLNHKFSETADKKNQKSILRALIQSEKEQGILKNPKDDIKFTTTTGEPSAYDERFEVSGIFKNIETNIGGFKYGTKHSSDPRASNLMR